MALDTYFWSGLCAGLVDEQIFTLFNQAAHGQDVEARIHKLDIVPQMPISGSNNGQYLPGIPIQVVRTSAQSGGLTMPAVPMDSTNPALPSQVELRAFPLVTQSAVLRRKVNVYFRETVDVPHVGGGSTNNKNNTGEMYDPGRGTTVIQELTLREGQGFAINFDPVSGFIGHPQPACFHATFTFQLSSGETYVTTTYLGSCPPPLASIGLFNNTGSGVVLKIVSLTIGLMAPISTFATPYFDDSTGNAAGRIRFSKVSGASGVPSIGTPMQSNAPVATDVFGWQQLPWNPVTSSLGQLGGMKESGLNPNLLGYPHANVMLVRGNFGSLRHQQSHVMSMLSAGGSTGPTDGDQYRDRTRLGLDYTRHRPNKATGIRLRAGEGLALIGSSNSAHPWWWVECTYTIHRPSKPATLIAQVVS